MEGRVAIVMSKGTLACSTHAQAEGTLTDIISDLSTVLSSSSSSPFIFSQDAHTRFWGFLTSNDGVLDGKDEDRCLPQKSHHPPPPFLAPMPVVIHSGAMMVCPSEQDNDFMRRFHEEGNNEKERLEISI